jgi:hypothetical protein
LQWGGLLLTGTCFLSYNLTHAADVITLNINSGELILENVPNDASTTFELTTTTTTGNNLGYTLSAFVRSSNSHLTIEKCNNDECTNTTPLSTNANTPTDIDITASQTTEKITTTKYKVTIAQGIADGTHNLTIAYHLAENQPPSTATQTHFATSNGSSGIVETDVNMIPIKYTGNTTTPQWQKANITNAANDWFNYNTQQWANAVTVTSATLQTYKDAPIGTIINESDVLGYWVYIPRYAYEVQRRDAIDAPITAQTPFDIRFEKATDGKKTPANTCSTGTPGDTITANHKDYRTGCSINRTYPGATTTSNTTTWSTHPAFTFGTQELNGLWVGKYETGTDFYCHNTTATTPANCGENVAPNNIYIKPGQSPMTYKYVGAMFRIANNMGVNQTVGGNTITNNTSTNTMNLAATNVHQQKNNEWGAAVYLSTSIFGVYGTNNVFTTENFTDAQKKVYNNGFYNSTVTTNAAHTTYDTANTLYMTGCGPTSDKSDTYNTTCNQYHTTIGQTASTTGNVYGLYDIAGGTWELVMGLRNATPSSLTYMQTLPDTAYYDNYPIPPFNAQPAGSDANDYFYSFDICTYQYCGGHSLHETVSVQSVSSSVRSWGSDRSYFMDSSFSWFSRGGRSYVGSHAGAFAVDRHTGTSYNYASWRAVAITQSVSSVIIDNNSSSPLS